MNIKQLEAVVEAILFTMGESVEVERLAAALAQSGMYAEQNSGIFRRHGARLGMEPPLLQEMKRIGVRIQTASDAHHPSEVGLGIQEAEALVLQASKP